MSLSYCDWVNANPLIGDLRRRSRSVAVNGQRVGQEEPPMSWKRDINSDSDGYMFVCYRTPVYALGSVCLNIPIYQTPADVHLSRLEASKGTR